MLGLFVVIVIGGPLVKVALDIQSSLASTSTFTPPAAAVIALLIVAAVIAAILAPE
jgi:fructose-specific phosphotransferase system IIC component